METRSTRKLRLWQLQETTNSRRVHGLANTKEAENQQPPLDLTSRGRITARLARSINNLKLLCNALSCKYSFRFSRCCSASSSYSQSAGLRTSSTTSWWASICFRAPGPAPWSTCGSLCKSWTTTSKVGPGVMGVIPDRLMRTVQLFMTCSLCLELTKKNILRRSHLLSYINSCCNPLVYGFMSRNFRRGFKDALKFRTMSGGSDHASRCCFLFRGLCPGSASTK